MASSEFQQSEKSNSVSVYFYGQVLLWVDRFRLFLSVQKNVRSKKMFRRKCFGQKLFRAKNFRLEILTAAIFFYRHSIEHN